MNCAIVQCPSPTANDARIQKRCSVSGCSHAPPEGKAILGSKVLRAVILYYLPTRLHQRLESSIFLPPAMHLHRVTLLILYQVLITTALSIDITHPNSLLQDHNTTSLRLPRPNPTNRYYVDCERVSDQGLPGLNPSNCLELAPVVCDHLANLRLGPVSERWVWIERSGCALGYFLPRAYQRHPRELLPSEVECNNDIYGAIIERCALDSR